MATNRETFTATLAAQYRDLFALPDYAMAAARYTPESLAEKMTAGLLVGGSSKDGDGIKRACKALGVKHTYKAIIAYLDGGVA